MGMVLSVIAVFRLRRYADADTPKKDVVVYEIVRQDGGTPKTVVADRNTPLKPGDMVVVSLQ